MRENDAKGPEAPSSAVEVAALLAGAPPERHVHNAIDQIRAHLKSSGQRLVVLDDDPTGSQSVHDVPVLTAWSVSDLSAAMEGPDRVIFVLTNSRSMAAPEAVGVIHEVATNLNEAAPHLVQQIRFVSRSDSTLRGHFPDETDELQAVASGGARPYNGVLLCPAFFEAGRVTIDDIHWTTVGDRLVPVGDTEFARDRAFGYTSSNLRDWVVEKSGGRIGRDDVASLSLSAIRLGGPPAVRDALAQLDGGQTIVVNAAAYSDLEVVVLGLLEAESQGRRFICRTGPSFVRVRAGIHSRGPLKTSDLYPDGARSGHGLVVVGSHTAQTSRQMAAATGHCVLAECEIQVPRLLQDDTAFAAEVDRVITQVTAALRQQNVLLFTSRTVAPTSEAAGALTASARVSKALTAVVAGIVPRQPLRWLVAKGGITSSDLATRGLGVRAARVLGQIFPGMVSVWRLEIGGTNTVGMPYVVFPGNVGDDWALVRVLETLQACTAQLEAD
jgi:uncharacterized protein YgbK (DUF1537 family)